MKERFESIYANHEWGGGSGEGSRPIHTRGYVRFLQNFLRNHPVRSVVDFGCGDWQFSRLVDWTGVNYTGFDVVGPVIAENQKNFGRPGIGFEVFNEHLDSLPAADLLIAKDVLQHWSNEAITRFLPVLSRYRWVLITNCCDPAGPTVNTEIIDGGFRYLDLREPPFGLPAKQVYSFTNSQPLWHRLLGRPPQWRKQVLLMEGRGTSPGHRDTDPSSPN